MTSSLICQRRIRRDSDKYAKNKATSYVTESGIRTKDDVLTHHNFCPNIDQDIQDLQASC